jgi:hypothetical protein
MARGEQTITKPDGSEVRVLFTTRALAEAETAVGKPVLQIFDELSRNAAGIGAVAQVLRAGMEAARRDAKGGGRPIAINDAYDLMDEVGFAAVVTAIAEGVTVVLGSDAPDPN